MNQKIIQIIPAIGWEMVIKNNGKLEKDPLVCWALIEDKNGQRRISGIMNPTDEISKMCPCDEINNFVGYELQKVGITANVAIQESALF